MNYHNSIKIVFDFLVKFLSLYIFTLNKELEYTNLIRRKNVKNEFREEIHNFLNEKKIEPTNQKLQEIYDLTFLYFDFREINSIISEIKNKFDVFFDVLIDSFELNHKDIYENQIAVFKQDILTIFRDWIFINKKEMLKEILENTPNCIKPYGLPDTIEELIDRNFEEKTEVEKIFDVLKQDDFAKLIKDAIQHKINEDDFKSQIKYLIKSKTFLTNIPFHKYQKMFMVETIDKIVEAELNIIRQTCKSDCYINNNWNEKKEKK